MDFCSHPVLWINLWKLWIAEALLCWGGREEALRATIRVAERRRDFGSDRSDIDVREKR